MNFSIVVPNYNGAQFLNNFLTSLAAAINNCPDSKFEIILIDNGSTDNSITIFKDFSLSSRGDVERSKTEGFRFKILDSNHGFAKAINIGIKLSIYDWITVLNNDLELDENWFKNISETKINPKIGAICGTVLNSDGTKLESQGLEFFYSGKAKNINNHIKYSLNLINRIPQIVWGASGAATIYNKKIIEKIGNFDETFFAYEEDIDLSLRLNMVGCQTLLIPNCLSYHLGGGTSNKMGNFRSYHDTKNWYFIIIKNYSFKQFFSNFPALFLERLKNLKYLIQSTHPFYIVPITIVKLYIEIFKNIPKLLEKRKVMQKLLK